MHPSDVMGCLYSQKGLRFGGFQTSEFISVTEPLESARPGVREEIVAEAHYLVHWLFNFSEIAFLSGMLIYKSVYIALLSFLAAFIIEIIRFYSIGPSVLLAQLSRLWGYARIPAFIIAAASLWSEERSLSYVLLTFLIVQGGLNLIGTVAMLPIRIAAGRIVYKMMGGQWHNLEGSAMYLVINRWRLKLFPADRYTA